MFRSKGIFIALVIECSLVGVVCAQSNNQVNNEKAKYVLDRIRETRNKMKNLQFDVETSHWALYRGIYKEGPEKTIHDVFNIVMDCNGREKRTLTQYSTDKSGNKRPNSTHSLIVSWNDDASVEYHKHGEGDSQGGATLRNSLPPILMHQYQPWRIGTGNFAKYIAAAIEAEKPVNVEALPDGKYRVSFTTRPGSETAGIIDPEKGFSCTSVTSRNLRTRAKSYTKTDYEKFTDGVWIPVARKTENTNSEGVVSSIFNAKVSNIKVNDPNFSDALFHVDLPKGTRVRDEVLGIRYVVGDPMSIRTHPDGISPNEVARSTLDEMVRETNQKQKEVKLFVPKVGLALEKSEPFVLGLAEGKLVNPKKKPESEESSKFLTKLGKGDIAWDGAVVATRGAKVLTIKEESKRPLKLIKGKWTRFYKLPDKVELPYSMLVVTREHMNFLLIIRKIESGGITVAYRQLNPDELILYKQKPEDN